MNTWLIVLLAYLAIGIMLTTITIIKQREGFTKIKTHYRADKTKARAKMILKIPVFIVLWMPIAIRLWIQES